jgi:hypothetical protein
MTDPATMIRLRERFVDAWVRGDIRAAERLVKTVAQIDATAQGLVASGWPAVLRDKTIVDELGTTAKTMVEVTLTKWRTIYREDKQRPKLKEQAHWHPFGGKPLAHFMADVKNMTAWLRETDSLPSHEPGFLHQELAARLVTRRFQDWRQLHGLAVEDADELIGDVAAKALLGRAITRATMLVERKLAVAETGDQELKAKKRTFFEVEGAVEGFASMAQFCDRSIAIPRRTHATPVGPGARDDVRQYLSLRRYGDELRGSH